MDLFLLWLLYKFTKPQRVLNDGMTEASTLLFAHDAKTATETLFGEYKEEYDRHKAELLQKKHDDFIAYVIKDWMAEMLIES